MPVRKRGRVWWYRFKVPGREYNKSTGLDAVRSNRSEAEKIEAQAKLGALAGIEEAHQSQLIPFTEAADEFLNWCFKTEYRSKVNTARRIKTSFASLMEFLRDLSVGSITATDIER
jgi:hypothetical protein